MPAAAGRSSSRRMPYRTVQPVVAPEVAASHQPSSGDQRGTVWKRVAPIGAVLFFATALWATRHALRGVNYATVWRAILSLSPLQLALALSLTGASYVALSGYDVLALRYVGRPLRYRRTALASFISFAFSNTVGLAFLAGASVRTRLYSAWGLTTPTIGKIIAFSAATLWLGVLTVSGTALVLEPAMLAGLLGAPAWAATLLGGAALLVVAGYFLWCGRWRRPLALWGWQLDPPPRAIAASQLLVSVLDWLAASAALFLLLPGGTGLSYLAFTGAFVAAQGLGLASQVPGGLGVFEGTLLLLIRGRAPAGVVAAALFAFRGIYYLLPLLSATALLTGHEALRQRERVGRVSRVLGRLVPAFTVPVLSVAVFATGSILLLSGATPAVGWRLGLLRSLVPLPVLEASHFAASLAGMGLLLVAYGLYRRLDAAWGLTAALLVAAIVTSVLKGLDFEEAAVAGVALAALIPARRLLYRRSSFLDERWSRGWLLAVAVALGTSVWLGFFAYRHVEYSSDLWWQFEFGADAPRFLRASVGAASLALVLAAVRLFRPPRPEPAAPTVRDLDRAFEIITASNQASASLALLGDKHLLFNDAGTAFLMYAVRGGSWIALGDPVGDESEGAELAWRFRELCDHHNGWPVFYEVSRHRLPLYLEQGLTLVKLGEEARVPLPGFTLEGGERASLRRWRNAAERAGCRVEILPAGASDSLLPDLQRVSDQWLAGRHTREKRFSLGAFSPAYIRHFPLAVVRQDDRMVAFATLWTTATREEVTVDLMRYAVDSPSNVMTYLFIHLMLWARGEGFRWFNLGMAPLAGLHTSALAPLWNRAGAFVFRHAENFYHFQGLREYKARFDPVWEPRYLASPGGLALPFILADITALIAGGLKGVFSK